MRRNFLLRRKRARLFQVSITQNPSYPSNSTATVTLVPTGAQAPYTVDIFEGALPTGMSVSGLTVTGIPTTAGEFNFKLRIWDNRDTLKIIPIRMVIT
jgi:hypothetical protein